MILKLNHFYNIINYINSGLDGGVEKCKQLLIKVFKDTDSLRGNWSRNYYDSGNAC